MARKKPLYKQWLGKPVEITWLDHVGLGPQWTPMEVIHNSSPAVFRSVGYLLKYTEDSVWIGSTVDEEMHETGDITILVRSCITAARKLD
jgi:hypothetical protein